MSTGTLRSQPALLAALGHVTYLRSRGGSPGEVRFAQLAHLEVRKRNPVWHNLPVRLSHAHRRYLLKRIEVPIQGQTTKCTFVRHRLQGTICDSSRPTSSHAAFRGARKSKSWNVCQWRDRGRVQGCVSERNQGALTQGWRGPRACSRTSGSCGGSRGLLVFPPRGTRRVDCRVERTKRGDARREA